MAFTGPEKVTIAEITQETYSLIDSLVSSLTAEQEDAIQADVVLWNANRNKVKVWIEGGRGGVNVRTKTLLTEIRMRTRNALGLPLYSDQTWPGSGSIRVRSVF